MICKSNCSMLDLVVGLKLGIFMYTKIEKVSFLGACLLSLGACGGGGGSGGSGIDSSKRLDTLTDTEIVEICEFTNGVLEEAFSPSVTCYFSAIPASTTPAECQTMYEACLASNVPPDPEDCSDAADDEFPACASMVSVGEVEACFIALADGTKSAWADVSCDTPQSELEDRGPDFETLPACKIVDDKCPALFDDTDE